MNAWLGQCSNSRNNNFNLIRFIAASLVLYSHSYALTSYSDDPLQNLTSFRFLSFGSLAVDIFFVTSGFLVTNSLFGRKNIFAFVWARILRIYPALIIAVLFCIFVVGLYFTELSAEAYLSHDESLSFFLYNAFLLSGDIQHTLPGVFLDLRIKADVISPEKNAYSSSSSSHYYSNSSSYYSYYYFYYYYYYYY